jgi:hypothetical protein
LALGPEDIEEDPKVGNGGGGHVASFTGGCGTGSGR